MTLLDTILRWLIEFFKSIDKTEITVFVVIYGMLLLLITLFYYSSVHRKVKQTSRCYREKKKGQSSKDRYMVHAMNERNEPLYTVTYTPAAKKFQVECACPKGTTVNHFNNIKVYDARNPENPVRKINDQMCYCDSFVEPKADTYYTGHPDLLRFMYNGNTGFFERLY